MKLQDQINDGLRAFGHLVGTRLALDATQQCAFVFDGIHFQVGWYEADACLLLAAELHERDVTARAPVLKALLEFAHLGGPSQRCGVSLTANGQPALWLWLNAHELDVACLGNALSAFVATAQHGHQLVEHSMQDDVSGASITFAQPSSSDALSAAFMQRV